MFDFLYDEDGDYQPDPERDNRSPVEMYQQACSVSWADGLGAQVYEYLTRVVGLPGEHLANQDWRLSESSIFSRHAFNHLLIPSLGPYGELLAVRGMLLKDARFLDIQEYRDEGSPFFEGAGVVAAPGQALAAEDVPSPFAHGLFDDEVVWAFCDPVAGLLLYSVGLTATSLINPCGTLGSAQGLHNLIEGGLLARRDRPKGTIVVVDPGRRLSPGGGALLRGFYNEVWEAPELTGPALFHFVHEVRQGGAVPKHLQGELIQVVRESGRQCNMLPKPLPPRTKIAPASSSGAPIKPLTWSDLATAPEGVEWLAQDLLAPNAVTLFQGHPKIGKTTFALGLAFAVMTGREFLGRPCLKSPVVLVTEQNATTIRASLRMALPAEVDFADLPEGSLRVVTMSETFGRSWHEVVSYVKEECVRSGARLAIFDTLVRVAGLEGEGENSAGSAGDLFRPIRELGSAGVAILASQHSRKGDGGIAETGRGSNALAGEADILLRIRAVRSGTNLRRLESVGRLGEGIDLVVERTAEGDWVERRKPEGGAPAEKQRAGKAERVRQALISVLTAVGERGVTIKEIMARTAEHASLSLTRFSADKALKALVDGGTVLVSGRGTKTEPLRYRLGLLPSPPIGGDE